MMDAHTAKVRATATYNAAADLFDDPRLSFWDRFGRRTVERLDLAPGSSVLDLCCGAGASALPAAERVGPFGKVLGVDLAENLVRRARVKASIRRLRNTDFQVGDLERLDLPPGSVDAVLCVFGIFFLADMAGALRRMWGWVRPGGQLAVTVWGRNTFQPAEGIFWEEIRAERPDLYMEYSPWEQVEDPEALRALFEESGIPDVVAGAEEGFHPTPEPEDWWTVVMGSGHRGTVEQLAPDARERVRARTLERFAATGVRQIEANVVYGVARKGAGAP
jgi:ubiquinone/menaquinone biosynthesis C-methylase UbiE